MDRKYFFELGAYDPGLKIWGGENFELSFKVCYTFAFVKLVPTKTLSLHLTENKKESDTSHAGYI